MALEYAPAGFGQREPGAPTLADEGLVHLEVTRLLQKAHLLGQHRVGHLDAVSDKAELDLGRRRQQSHYGEANRVGEEVIQPVPRMGQRHRPTNHAAMRSGSTAIAALIEKWKPGWC